MDSVIYTRIKELCDEKEIPISKLEEMIPISNGLIGKWKGSITPSLPVITKIAQYLHTSVDYLIGATDIRTPVDDILGDKDIVTIQRAREAMGEKSSNKMMNLLRIAFDEYID